MKLNDRMIKSRTNQLSGWICPQCGKANAPCVMSCDHKPVVMVNAGICFLGSDDEPVQAGHLHVISGD